MGEDLTHTQLRKAFSVTKRANAAGQLPPFPLVGAAAEAIPIILSPVGAVVLPCAGLRDVFVILICGLGLCVDGATKLGLGYTVH